MKKIIEKARSFYINLPKPLRSSFWFMVCIFLQRGISMITTPIFTRIMPLEEYGMTSTFTSLQSILEIFISLELAACGMVLYVKQEERKEAIASALSSLEIVVTSIWMIFFGAFLGKISELLQISKILCICLLFTIMSSQLIQIWMSYKRYIYDYRKAIGITLLTTILTSILGIVGVLLFSPSAESRLVPYTIVNFIISIFLYVSLLKQGRVFFDKYSWKFAFSYGVPLLPHYVSQFILSSSDRLMISYMCGKKDVALYSVAYAVGSMIGSFTYAINASFAPYQFQHIRSKEYRILAKTANIVLLFVALILIGIMLFGREVIWLFAGDRYMESAAIVVPICIGIFFNYLFQLFARIEEYYLHKMMIAAASMLCAALNIVLNLIFIKKYGYQAAAYTTMICYMAFCVVHYLFYLRVLRIEEKGAKIYDGKGLSLISLLVMTSGIFIFWIQDFPLLKYSIAVCVFLYLIAKRKILIDALGKLLR